jgi:hypothetical protein
MVHRIHAMFVDRRTGTRGGSNRENSHDRSTDMEGFRFLWGELTCDSQSQPVSFAWF